MKFGFAPAYKLGVDRFHIFVAAILILLILESLLGTRRRTSAASDECEIRFEQVVGYRRLLTSNLWCRLRGFA